MHPNKTQYASDRSVGFPGSIARGADVRSREGRRAIFLAASRGGEGVGSREGFGSPGIIQSGAGVWSEGHCRSGAIVEQNYSKQGWVFARREPGLLDFWWLIFSRMVQLFETTPGGAGHRGYLKYT